MYTISSDKIQMRVRELGLEISEDYKNSTPVFITLLKGAFIFLADLVRELTIPHEIDFITLSSYRNGLQRSKTIEINNLIRNNIEERDIIIVDEIIDTGNTLSKLMNNLLDAGAKSIKICTLLDKQTKREVEIPIDYKGFSIPDVFVIGYGLDFKEHFRHLSFIRELTSDLREMDGINEQFSKIEKEIKEQRI
ncbi:MAG: hypoxanthine phosphoribosyltransferase [Candidatus Krumholzibacteriota bacterium]|nr:hypoxanthine phosphoribosyltransferase [Candidatus Krumholzibacteriota bacterium]